MHTITRSSLLLALCSLPAFADPPPSSPPVRLSLGIKQGADTRTYQLVVGDATCGGIASKATDHDDRIRVCANSTPQGMRLKVDWSMSSYPSKIEYHTDFETTVKLPATIEVGPVNSVRLSLQAN